MVPAAESPHDNPDNHTEDIKNHFAGPCRIIKADVIGGEPGEVGYGASGYPLHADILRVGVVIGYALVVAHHKIEDEDESCAGEEERHGEGYLDDNLILDDDVCGYRQEEEEDPG